MIKEVSRIIGNRGFKIETGKMAKQASGSVVIRSGDSMLLVTVVGNRKSKEGQDFFPLSVEYREMRYSAGKIPGGFFKREGRSSEREILTARLTDRPLRPCFPEDFFNDVQIFCTVLSADRVNNPDAMAITAASAALMISNIPFDGPVSGARVGRVDGEFILNPTFEEIEKSDMEMIVAGNRESITMIEGELKEVPEADVLEAVKFAQKHIAELCDLQMELAGQFDVQKFEYEPKNQFDEEFKNKVYDYAYNDMKDIILIVDKNERKEKASEYYAKVEENFAEEEEEILAQLPLIFHAMENEISRRYVLEEKKRIDGRDFDEIRQITCEPGLLPMTHGSALFTRGQTQSLGTVTLGTVSDQQIIDALEGEWKKPYMLHYNFPSFSVGEIRPARGPGRREIGHGNLAERSLKQVLPNFENFPYTIRIVSDILESNGSSSMASVCSGSLALMDAGVPVSGQVSGIAMGLIKDGDNYQILTDIQGAEDHFGDMDLKVAGTAKGVTACQMDLKIQGISFEILEHGLEKALKARTFIREKMDEVLAAPREKLSPNAPRIETIRIKQDKIKDLIGSGGKTIKKIIEDTGAVIDIEDDGLVTIAAENGDVLDKTKELVLLHVTDPEIGEVFTGVVKRIENYGAFLEILPGKQGFLHISELSWERTQKVEDEVEMGQEMEVKVVDIDNFGKIRVSRKALLPKQKQVAYKKKGKTEEDA